MGYTNPVSKEQKKEKGMMPLSEVVNRFICVVLLVINEMLCNQTLLCMSQVHFHKA